MHSSGVFHIAGIVVILLVVLETVPHPTAQLRFKFSCHKKAIIVYIRTSMHFCKGSWTFGKRKQTNSATIKPSVPSPAALLQLKVRVNHLIDALWHLHHRDHHGRLSKIDLEPGMVCNRRTEALGSISARKPPQTQTLTASTEP